MNIHNNRYVIFIAPLIWSITVMFYTHSMYNISLAMLFIFHNCINLIVISHKTFLKYNTHQWYYYYTYILKQTIAQAFICIVGYPQYAFIGSFIIFYDPYKINLIVSAIWLSLYIVSFVFYVGSIRWWGILLLGWGFIRNMCHEHMEKIAMEKRHNFIWSLKLLETVIMYTIRWFTFCEMSFPHIIRYDVTVYSLGITIMLMYWVTYKFKSEELIYTKKPDKNHFPAPDKETAEACKYCKDIIKIIDVENQEGKIL